MFSRKLPIEGNALGNHNLKILQIPGSVPLLRQAAAPRSAPARTAEPAAETPATTNVHPLPPKADETFDADRVAAIRDDIRAGRYQFNAERIADGLLANISDFVSHDR